MISRYSPILKALTYIDAHLCEKLAVQDLAAVSGYSLFHFTRLFNQYVGLTPYDYLIRRRLSVAAEALLIGKKRIIDIAQDYQFGSHESFTRAFNRLFGMPPSQWRERGFAEQKLLMPAIGEQYLTVLNEVLDRRPTVIQFDPISLVGWTISTETNNMAGIWEIIKQALPDHDPAKRWIVRTTGVNPGLMDLQFVGVQTDWRPDPSQLFVNYVLEGGDFLKFSLNQTGELSHISAVLVFLHHCVLPKIKYRIASSIILIHWAGQMDVMFPMERGQ